MAPLHRARHWSLSLDVELPCLARPAKPPISDYPAVSPLRPPHSSMGGGQYPEAQGARMSPLMQKVCVTVPTTEQAWFPFSPDLISAPFLGLGVGSSAWSLVLC